jgi:CRISPR/Cas system-associated endonuclease Cas1
LRHITHIPVSILGWSGQFLGGFLPAQNAHGLARLRQYRQTLDPAFVLRMAGRIFTAKLYAQYL